MEGNFFLLSIFSENGLVLVAFSKVGKVCLQFIDNILCLPSHGPIRDIRYVSIIDKHQHMHFFTFKTVLV